MSHSREKSRQKIQRLAQMARDLRSGKNFKITRLTTIKSLAEEPKSAHRFVLHLAKRAEQVIQKSRRPQGMKKSAWEKAQTLAAEAVTELGKYVKRRSASREATLRNLFLEIKTLQSEYKPISWGQVRIIYSRELLIIEKTIECCLSAHRHDHLAYEVARDYAERYDSKSPNGLVPTSAPYVKDIAEFWCQEHFGKNLKELFGD